MHLRILSDGRSLVTAHPVGLPEVPVQMIASRLEPYTAERLTAFPSLQTSAHADPHHLHRVGTTVLDPTLAPALERLGCSHERGEIDACIDAHTPSATERPVVARERTRWSTPGTVRTASGPFHRALVDASLHPALADVDPARLRFMHAVEV
jgi:hypothetical protein